MTQESDALLPCPICGSAGRTLPNDFVTCSNRGCFMSDVFPSFSGWNTRHQASPISKRVEDEVISVDEALRLVDEAADHAGAGRDALRAALKPLAELVVGSEVIEDRDLILYKNGGKCITVGDVLDARKALSTPTSEDSRHD